MSEVLTPLSRGCHDVKSVGEGRVKSVYCCGDDG